MTGSRNTVIQVDVANDAQSSGRTRTAEPVDKIMTQATVLTWIRLAIVDVQLTVLTL
jgi:hypothetical protein